MLEQDIGSVPIIDDDHRLQGIITDRDIALAVAAEGLDPQSTRAGDIMSRGPLAAEIDADLDFALEQMHKAHAKRLPVTEHGRVVGILSSTDLAGAMRTRLDQFFEIDELDRH